MVMGIGNALLIPALSTIYLGATAEQNRSQMMGIQCCNGSASGCFISKQLAHRIGYTSLPIS